MVPDMEPPPAGPSKRRPAAAAGLASAGAASTGTARRATTARSATSARRASTVRAVPGGPRRPGRLAGLAELVERRPYEEHWVDIGGLALHCEVHGSGPRVLLFMHGILLDTQMNRRLAGDLAERGFRVVLLDLPGHGLSDKPRHASAHRMDSYARLVLALMDELGLAEAAVGGVSLGANVALQVAVRAPERVVGLVAEMPVLEWAVPGAAMAFVPLLMGVHYAAPLVRLVAAGARRLPHTGIGVLDSVLTTLKLQPEEAAAVLHGMLVGPIAPTYEERHNLFVPTLVIGHKADVIHPFTDADHLARQLPDARLVQARSVVELRLSPERLTAEIDRFLDDAWRGRFDDDRGAARRHA